MPAEHPIYVTIKDWIRLSGIGRTSTFALLGNGSLSAKKAGRRTLINLESGLAYLAALPARRPL